MRRPRWTPEMADEAVRLYQAGQTMGEIGRAYHAAWGYSTPGILGRCVGRELRRRGIRKHVIAGAEGSGGGVPGKSSNYILAARIAPLIERWEAQNPDDTREMLATRAHVTTRLLWSILSGRQQYVSVFNADRLLVAMDMVELWHTELADLYEIEAA